MTTLWRNVWSRLIAIAEVIILWTHHKSAYSNVTGTWRLIVRRCFDMVVSVVVSLCVQFGADHHWWHLHGLVCLWTHCQYMVLLLSSDYTRKRWFACMPSIMLLKYALLGLLYQERKRFKPLHRPLKSEKNVYEIIREKLFGYLNLWRMLCRIKILRCLKLVRICAFSQTVTNNNFCVPDVVQF